MAVSAGGRISAVAPASATTIVFAAALVLVRIAFQRANPTFGNYGNKKAVVHLVNYPGSGMTTSGCLQTMLEEEVLPRAGRDTSEVFRETVMTELSVLKVLDVSCAPRDSELVVNYVGMCRVAFIFL